MYQKEEIVEQLGIETWPEDKKNEAVEIAIYRIGEAVNQSLSEQQSNEYQAIINDNQDVINAWLDANIPNYKDSPIYQEFETGYDEDPEKNNPAKLFASVAWIQMNVPNVNDLIAQALDAYKQELNTA
jgi:hypothetical protein